jgi:hypothetical protein
VVVVVLCVCGAMVLSCDVVVVVDCVWAIADSDRASANVAPVKSDAIFLKAMVFLLFSTDYLQFFRFCEMPLGGLVMSSGKFRRKLRVSHSKHKSYVPHATSLSFQWAEILRGNSKRHHLR